jgi:hypothetical protein
MWRFFNITEIYAVLEGIPKYLRADVYMMNFKSPSSINYEYGWFSRF